MEKDVQSCSFLWYGLLPVTTFSWRQALLFYEYWPPKKTDKNFIAIKHVQQGIKFKDYGGGGGGGRWGGENEELLNPKFIYLQLEEWVVQLTKKNYLHLAKEWNKGQWPVQILRPSHPSTKPRLNNLMHSCDIFYTRHLKMFSMITLSVLRNFMLYHRFFFQVFPRLWHT